jgi:AraC-like DNA-binding protein
MDDYPKIYLYRRVVQAKLYIDIHYADNPDLDNIADEACFSKFHFIRLFKKIYGKTPHQYLTQVRLNRAEVLLKTRVMISEVCFQLGFDSVSSFTGLFKRSHGLTPSAYQKLHFQRQQEMSEQPLKFVPHCFAEQKGWSQKSNFQEAP